MFSRTALILLLALACSSVLILFDDQLNLNHYLTFYSQKITPSKNPTPNPPPNTLNETSLNIPVQKMKRKDSTVFFIEMTSKTEKLKLILDSGLEIQF
jgi:hypothetical protein